MKYIFTIFICFLGLICPKALEENFVKGEEIRGAYVKVKDIEVKVNFYYDKNGEVVYLSNPGIYTLGNNKYQLMNEDLEKYEQIIAIANYGYGYDDHSAQKWYVITQLMIWQELYGKNNAYFIDGFGGEKVTKYEEDIEELEDLLIKNELNVDLGSTKVNVELGKEVVLKDKNNVLAMREILEKVEQVKKEDNNLIVQANKKENFIIEIVNDGGRFENDFHVYSNGENIVFEPGRYEFRKDKIEFIVTYGNVEFSYIKDSVYCTKCNYHKYRIYDENNKIVKEINALSDKKFDLAPGKYYIKDYGRDLGIVKDDKIYEFEVVNQEKVKVDIQEKRIFNTIKILKYNDKVIDNDSSFEIYDGKQLVTKVNGGVDFKLGYGDFYLKQITGNKVYEYIADTIKVRSDEISQDKKYEGKKGISVPDTWKSEYLSSLLLIIGGFGLIKGLKK